MTADTPSARARRAKELSAAATSGPWFSITYDETTGAKPPEVAVSCTWPDFIGVATMDRALTATLTEQEANAALIAESRTLLPQIADDVLAGEAELEALRAVTAEAYQVVGNLAHLAGVFDHPQVNVALDNLSGASTDAQQLPHVSMLPFGITPTDVTRYADEQAQEICRLTAQHAADQREIERLKGEIDWLRRLLDWCRRRLRRDGYVATLDSYIANGPSDPPIDEPEVVLS